jgi:hypothetical protein
MTSGSRLKVYCPGRPAIAGAAGRTTDCLSRRFFGSRVRAVRGETCQESSAVGIRRTSDLRAGPKRVSGIACSPALPRSASFARSSLIRPSFEPTSMPLAPPKKRRASARAIPRRTDNEDSRLGRRAGATHSGPADCRRGARCHSSSRPAARYPGQESGSRQGLRRGCFTRADSSWRCESSYPTTRQSPRAAALEQEGLLPSQSHRAILLSHQTLPPHCNALREARRTVCILHLHRRQGRLAAVNVNTPQPRSAPLRRVGELRSKPTESREPIHRLANRLQSVGGGLVGVGVAEGHAAGRERAAIRQARPPLQADRRHGRLHVLPAGARATPRRRRTRRSD